MKAVFPAMLVLLVTSTAHAALVWESTFDSDADGVIGNEVNTNELCGPGGPPCPLDPIVFGQDYEGLGNGSVMIGANSGGVQDIVLNSILLTPVGNKAGRPTSDNGGPAALTRSDSWSALYTFNWTLDPVPENGAVSMIAGAIQPICCNSATHVTRHHVGARIERFTTPSGDQFVQVGGGWASEGHTFPGRDLGLPINLTMAVGGNPDGHPLQLAMGYDGATEILTVSLHDGMTGDVIDDGSSTAMTSRELGMFSGLGFPPGSGPIINELNGINNTRIGFSEFTQASNDVDTTWHMDSLRFYDDPQGAFDDVVSGTVLLPGDADNSGTVTADDLIAVQQNFGSIGPNGDGTDFGDANDDGSVTADDLISVQQNFGNTLAVAAAVPEPAGFALAALIGLTALRGRR